MKSGEKRCPQCAEDIKLEALVCKHCGYQFNAAEIAATKKKREGDAKKGAVGCAALIVMLVLGVSMCSKEPSETPAEKQAKATKAVDDRRKGMHCLSDWDGSNTSFVNEVKSKLRDPGSFEHVETRVTPVDKDGDHTIFMRYRARNGFGGVNNPTATGYVRQSDCIARVVATSIGSE